MNNLIVVDYRPHAKAACKWLLYDMSEPSGHQQIASFDDQQIAATVRAVLVQNLDLYHDILRAAQNAEHF